jgi:Pvc16 N-terminal domain/Carboxypeptidase regulatory-like domain
MSAVLMIPAVVQTLAEILAGGTSLTSTEQISFESPSVRSETMGPALNLYFYDLRESAQMQHSGRQVDRRTMSEGPQAASIGWAPAWFDVSFLITAWDRTALGEHHLLSEALTLLLRHRLLREDLLAPALRGSGNLSMTVSAVQSIDMAALWNALGIPLRPAVQVTVTTPFNLQSTPPIPLVWERILQLQSEPGGSTVRTKRVAVAGLVKSAISTLPLEAAEVVLVGTEKMATSNEDGLFYFENLALGHHILELRRSGYMPQRCNVLVDGQNYAFKEVLLTPT